MAATSAAPRSRDMVTQAVQPRSASYRPRRARHAPGDVRPTPRSSDSRTSATRAAARSRPRALLNWLRSWTAISESNPSVHQAIVASGGIGGVEPEHAHHSIAHEVAQNRQPIAGELPRERAVAVRPRIPTRHRSTRARATAVRHRPHRQGVDRRERFAEQSRDNHVLAERLRRPSPPAATHRRSRNPRPRSALEPHDSGGRSGLSVRRSSSKWCQPSMRPVVMSNQARCVGRLDQHEKSARRQQVPHAPERDRRSVLACTALAATTTSKLPGW